jgi:hypothetical protein
MRKARAFFFISAGVFLLALAYHFGARNATAQTPPAIECALVHYGYEEWAVVGRRLYQMQQNGPVLQDNAEIPGTARVIACGVNGVVLENGDVYELDGTEWSLKGSFLTPTPTQKSTWGAVKTRYR